MLPTQHPVRMAPSFQLLKISFFAEYTHNQPYLLLQSAPDGKTPF